MSVRRVTTETPKPHPRPSNAPSIIPPACFWAGVSWSVVMASTAAREITPPLRTAPAVEQHPGEGEEVIDGGHEAGGAGGKGRRPAPLASGRIRLEQGTGVRIGGVGGDEAVHGTGRHGERGVVHRERVEHPFAQDLVERSAGGAGDEDADDVGAGAVHPPGAGLVEQGQGAEAADPLVGPGHEIRSRGALAELELHEGVGQRHRAGWGHDDAEAQREGEEVPHEDRAPGGHDPAERGVLVLEHLAVGELREQAVDGLVEVEEAVLDAAQRGHGGHGLGHRRDAEQCVAA